jgi:hypothetical protein
MKVRKGFVYVYTREASFWEMADAKHGTPSGTLVRVVHPRGCPPPNMMGHAHIETLEGEFIGLVHTASLSGVIKKEEANV